MLKYFEVLITNIIVKIGIHFIFMIKTLKNHFSEDFVCVSKTVSSN